YVVPLTVLILVMLFAVQSRGTASVAAFFGPIMLVYFITIAALGIAGIATQPQVIAALNPLHAVAMFTADPWRGFLAM
ncbi:KUP/HAK/KT family potassium transporter, partial [Shewanella algae]|uniref:KUP/HAK/KT family potassium transporter n=1 Tax=Shewanella algae TaxID=38313 RepID=UPI00313C0129